MASSRKYPTSYVIHTYGTLAAGRAFQLLSTWNTFSAIDLTLVTTTDQDSSGNTLYVTSTTKFENCVLNRSTITVAGQVLTITGITAGVSLSVTTLEGLQISGTIVSGSAISCGFVLECYADSATYDDSGFITGATNTSANYFRVITAASGHRGTRTSGVRFENLSVVSIGSEYHEIINVGENYACVYNIAGKITTSSVLDCTVFKGFVGCSENRFVGCTVYDLSLIHISEPTRPY